MTVSGVVMAHQKRQAWAEALSEQLDIPIVWDQVNDRHDTGLRCLQAGLGSDATHWLVVQDDALVCRDLLDGLAKATEFSGDRVVGLYVGNRGTQNGVSVKRFQAARAAGSAWVSMPGPLWGVGIVVPTVHLPALTAHFAKSREQNYDRRVEKWATSAKVECWYTIPSLVEHRHGPENPSLIPRNRTSLDRHAQWFLGEDISALDVDWSRTPRPVSDLWRRRGTSRIVRATPGSSQARRLAQSGTYEPVIKARCGECGNPRYLPIEDEPCP